MSRIEEAMRRAAEEAAEAPQERRATAVATPGLSHQDHDEVAREAFPVEMPDRRQRASSAHPQPPLAAFAPVMGPVPPAAPSLPDVPRPGSLMERIDHSVAEKIVIDHNTMPSSREQYRRLGATLHHTQAKNGLKVILVTSAVPGEGKTLTASNLALTFSESYQRSVLLIDADLRRPTLHTIFHINNNSGLSEGLAAKEQRALPVRQFSPRLAILPAGQATSDPTAGLTSERMQRLIAEARDVFDWVIIDTPPVALLSDAKLLAAMADGVVFVVKAGSTPFELVKRAIDALGRERLLGAVLNRAQQSTHVGGYGYYQDYYTATPSKDKAPVNLS